MRRTDANADRAATVVDRIGRGDAAHAAHRRRGGADAACGRSARGIAIPLARPLRDPWCLIGAALLGVALLLRFVG